MSKWREEHYYLCFLLIVFLFEIYLSIPFSVPLFDSNLNVIYIVEISLHIIGLLLLMMKLTEIRPYSVHLLGIVGFFVSVIPYINFLFHLLVAFKLYKAMRNIFSFVREINVK